MLKTTLRRTGRAVRRGVGFTLAEILIALALIAILAAVLLPSVAGQIMKGDAGRTMQDLDAVRAGIEQFLADVHRYPQKYQQLTRPLTGTDEDINGAIIPAGLRSRWAGPYVTKELNTNSELQTGFGATIQDSLVIAVQSPGSSNFLTVRIFDIDTLGFMRLEDAIDGTPASSVRGLIQWATGTPTVTKYLATPIQ